MRKWKVTIQCLITKSLREEIIEAAGEFEASQKCRPLLQAGPFRLEAVEEIKEKEEEEVRVEYGYYTPKTGEWTGERYDIPKTTEMTAEQFSDALKSHSPCPTPDGPEKEDPATCCGACTPESPHGEDCESTQSEEVLEPEVEEKTLKTPVKKPRKRRS